MSKKEEQQHHRELLTYIKKQVRRRTAGDTIRRSLVNAGWDPETVDKALDQQRISYSKTAVANPNSTSNETDSVYPIFQALANTYAILKFDPKRTIGILALGAAGSLVVALVVSWALITTANNLDSSQSARVPLFIAAIIVSLLATVCISSLELCLVAAKFSKEAENHPISVRKVIKISQERFWRVLKASFLSSTVILGPLFVIISIIALIAVTAGPSTPLTATFTVISFIAGCLWTVFAAFNYALTPFIAFFEPKISIRQSLPRSRHLMKGGGRWFIIKLLGLTGLAYLAVLILLGIIPMPVQATDLLFDGLSAAMSAFSIGLLTMLYRNRIKVRGNTPAKMLQ